MSSKFDSQKAVLKLEGENRVFEFTTYSRCGEVIDAFCRQKELTPDVVLFRMMQQFLRFCADTGLGGPVDEELLRMSAKLYQAAIKGYPVCCAECGATSVLSKPLIAAQKIVLCPGCFEALTERYGHGPELDAELIRRYRHLIQKGD